MCKFCSIKCWFIFFNTLILASGVALITIGAMQYSTYLQMGIFAGSSLSKIAIILLTVGIVIALISILGHIGATMDNYVMLACFICILVVTISLEILTGASFYVFRSRIAILQVNSDINTKARGGVYEYSPENRYAINRIQEKFSCCGADTYSDWFRSVGWNNHTILPDSCCTVKSEGCGQDKSKVHKKGCIWAIKLFLLSNLVSVGAVCMALGVAEVFGILVGVCLCLAVKRKEYESIN
ncbi:CD63 antigen-like [Scomber scombrus]|uniref:CD63 antigen-like n=1 Tax=Scomber scombrus TaxID=13677 RepID=UPI002DD7F85A|nr:CD63 antigen-like [Scomber scombrus]